MFTDSKVSGEPASSHYTELPRNTDESSELTDKIKDVYTQNTTDTDAEFEKITTIEDIKIRKIRILKFAEDHMNPMNWEKIHKEFLKINHGMGNEMKPLFIKLAETFLINGDRESVLKLPFRSKFAVEIAESFLAEGNREKALESIRNCPGDYAGKKEFLVKLAEACLEAKDIEIAFKIYRFLRQIQYPEMQALANKFAESFLQNEDIQNCQRAMSDMCEGGSKLKLSFKIVEYYLTKGMGDLALKTFEDAKCRICLGTTEAKIDQEDFYCMMQFYFNHRDLITPLKLIENIVIQLGTENIKRECPNFLYDLRCKKFLDDLVKTCFEKVEKIVPKKFDEWTIKHLRNQLISTTYENTVPEKIEEFTRKEEPKETPETEANTMKRERSPYEILGLSEDASIDDIKKKYRELARIYHPDKMQKVLKEEDIDFEIRKKESEDKFAEIFNAYESLTQ